MPQSKPRPLARTAVVTITLTALLWAAVLPFFLEVMRADEPAVVLTILGATILMWGNLALKAVGQRTVTHTAPAVQRAWDALDQLDTRLSSGDLPATTAADVRGALHDLRAEATVFAGVVDTCDRESPTPARGAWARRRAEAVQRLADIAAAAEAFVHQVDVEPARSVTDDDATARLQAARRAFEASAREVR